MLRNFLFYAACALVCVLLFGLFVLLAFQGPRRAVQPAPQQYSWDDPQPVYYSDPGDNIEIEIDFDGYKRKVKRGDYRTGRYKSFTKRVVTPAPTPSKSSGYSSWFSGRRTSSAPSVSSSSSSSDKTRSTSTSSATTSKSSSYSTRSSSARSSSSSSSKRK